jgi:hypothetical protein
VPQCLSSFNTEAAEDLSDLSVEALPGAEDTERIAGGAYIDLYVRAD